jgi:hypothetical protein
VLGASGYTGAEVLLVSLSFSIFVDVLLVMQG